MFKARFYFTLILLIIIQKAIAWLFFLSEITLIRVEPRASQIHQGKVEFRRSGFSYLGIENTFCERMFFMSLIS